MREKTDAKTVCAIIKQIAEGMGSPSDLRVMPVGKDGLSHLLYLNSLVADETIAWVTDQFTTLGALPTAAPDIPVKGRVYPLDDPSAAALFGLHGLTIAGIVVLVHAADLKSFGVSYLAPWAPLQWEELGDAPVRKPFWARWHRPETYRPRNILRTGGTKREDDEEDA